MGATRLSPLDAAFLYLEKPHQRLHVGCVAVLDGPVPFPAFVEAMEERLGSLPRYHQRPVRPLMDLDWPRWEDDPDFDVRRHLRHVAAPPPGEDAQLHELVDMLFATPLDGRHPLWETYLIDGLTGGRSAILCKIHHAMIDGVSGAQVLEVMADAPPQGRVNGGRGNGAAPLRTASRLRAMLQTAASPTALLARAREAMDTAGTVASLFLEPTSTLPFNGPITDARRIVWASFALDDFLAIRGANACKVNDVILAVIAGALRRYLEARGVSPDGLRVRTLVPVSVRGAEDHLTLGNLVSAMFPRLPVEVADPVQRLQRMAAEMRTLKERGQARASGAALALIGALPPPIGALLARVLPDRSPLNTVCTNVPGPREACRILGRRLVEVHPIVPLFQGMGLEFAILSYAGRLSICAAAEPHLVPDADTIPAHLEAAAAELRAALGVGPARPDVRTAGPRVGELMSREVITVGEADSLARAYQLMQAHRIRHLPVVDRQGGLIGIVTHRDLLAASSSSLVHRSEADRVRLLAWARVGDVMETHISMAEADDAAVHAGERMIRHKIGCLPVVNKEGGLLGIVTEEDFLRWATAQMAPAPARVSA